MTTQLRADVVPPSTRLERHETIIIGAGQAGLATGYHLQRRGLDCTILSAEARVGDNWRRRWDSLRLFTPAKFSGLPAMPFPAPPTHLADKDEVADYLERYADRIELPVRLDSGVRALRFDDRRYLLTMNDEAVLEADNVVVATGALQRPNIPAVSGHLAPEIHQLHSSEYRKPFAMPEGSVLVVGAGNSGAQIAMEVGRHRKVWLAGRDTGHLPRRALGRDLFDWAWPMFTWATTQTALGRRMSRDAHRGDALIGIPEAGLRRAGTTRVARLSTARGGLPVCGDTVLHPRVVIWCTGYQPDFAGSTCRSSRATATRGTTTARPTRRQASSSWGFGSSIASHRRSSTAWGSMRSGSPSRSPRARMRWRWCKRIVRGARGA